MIISSSWCSLESELSLPGSILPMCNVCCEVQLNNKLSAKNSIQLSSIVQIWKFLLSSLFTNKNGGFQIFCDFKPHLHYICTCQKYFAQKLHPNIPLSHSHIVMIKILLYMSTTGRWKQLFYCFILFLT